MADPNSHPLKQYLPVKQPKQRFFTAEEVSNHNTANDCWVVLFGEVYDLTAIVQKNIANPLTTPLLQAAGTDITYWFDTASREPRVRTDPTSGQQDFYCPKGRYLHIDSEGEVKWWKDSSHIIGRLTKKARRIRIINMINDHCTILEVPSEEIIKEILTRYLRYNKHGASYVWKRLGRPLDMQKTLSENGIEDEDGEFDRLDVTHANWYIPAIHLFFSDDLTVA